MYGADLTVLLHGCIVGCSRRQPIVRFALWSWLNLQIERKFSALRWLKKSAPTNSEV